MGSRLSTRISGWPAWTCFEESKWKNQNKKEVSDQNFDCQEILSAVVSGSRYERPVSDFYELPILGPPRPCPDTRSSLDFGELPIFCFGNPEFFGKGRYVYPIPAFGFHSQGRSSQVRDGRHIHTCLAGLNSAANMERTNVLELPISALVTVPRYTIQS